MIWSKLILSILTLYAGNIYALDAQEVFKKVSPSVVVIKTSSGQGSGVATRIGRNGLVPNTYIISNCHVVTGETSVIVQRLGKSTIGKVVLCDPERDVALISIDGELPVVEERFNNVEIGEKVYAVGSPRGLELSISEGVISQLRPSDLGGRPIIQNTTPISPGSSGGGLFDQAGRIIGITTKIFKDSQSLNFAMPVSYVNDSIEANKNNVTKVQEVKKCGYVPFPNVENVFLEPCSLVPYLSFKSVWTLSNYEKPEGDTTEDKYLSSTHRWIVDCSTQTVAVKHIVQHEKTMGAGKEVNDISIKNENLKFTDAIPNTIADLILKYLCLP